MLSLFRNTRTRLWTSVGIRWLFQYLSPVVVAMWMMAGLLLLAVRHSIIMGQHMSREVRRASTLESQWELEV
jgi:hypothetical protein